ncbi:MAG: metal-dependent transcriptional regulator [Zestosphaera sp.]
MDLSESIEDYVLTVYRLEKLCGVARTAQIARELKIREGTVSKVMKKLQSGGLVVLSSYRGVRLTDNGRRIAEKILRKHAVLETFLSNYLGFDLIKAHYLAHRMEHLPDEVIEAIYVKLGRPSLRYLMSLVGEVKDLDKVLTLNKTTPGRCYEITHLYVELSTVLDKLVRSGCGYPCVVRVEGLGSKGISVSTRKTSSVFTHQEGEAIYVQEVDCSE